ncbi:PH domain-containing protein [Georgenia sp. 10Sc9-8]|uniref:PH domain-containing protein n=1 Tax=Georgenia halotolerans TaxID=3028317 RepID=A0ABT5TV52_9MICO|nr:PH domain-containing protein [Georgenia halotolerans]
MTVVRHGASRAYAVVTWLIAAVFLGSFLLAGGPVELLRYGAHPLLLAALGWAVFWQPRVELEPQAVTVVNILRSVRVPYAAITEVGTQWGLRLHTVAGHHDAWATPTRALNRRDDSEPGRAVGSTRTGDAQSVARMIERRRGDAAPGHHGAAAAVTAWWNTREVVVLAAAAALSGLTVLVT